MLRRECRHRTVTQPIYAAYYCCCYMMPLMLLPPIVYAAIDNIVMFVGRRDVARAAFRAYDAAAARLI